MLSAAIRFCGIEHLNLCIIQYIPSPYHRPAILLPADRQVHIHRYIHRTELCTFLRFCTHWYWHRNRSTSDCFPGHSIRRHLQHHQPDKLRLRHLSGGKINADYLNLCFPNLKVFRIGKREKSNLPCLHLIQQTGNILIILTLCLRKPRILSHTL